MFSLFKEIYINYYKDMTAPTTFASAMRNTANLMEGDNGALIHRTSNSARVDTFTNMIKTSNKEAINNMIDNMFDEYKNNTTHLRNQIFRDIFVLGFHKRGTSKLNSN